MMMRVSGTFDTSRENAERKRSDANESRNASVCLSRQKKKPPPLSSQFAVIEVVGDTKRKKDTQKEPTFMYICACVSF